MSEVCYVSPEAPSLSIGISVEGAKIKQRVKFINKQLRLDDEKDAKLIAALDELIATQSNVSTLMYKVDMAAAEKLALAHKESLLQMRGTVAGPVSADDAKRAVGMAISERDADLASQGADVKDLENMRNEMSKGGLELTEDSKGVVASPVKEGFVPDPTPEPVPQEDPPAAKAVFANLSGTK